MRGVRARFAEMIAGFCLAGSVDAAVLASYSFTGGSAASGDTDPLSVAGDINDTKTYIGISAANGNAFMQAYSGTTPAFSTNFTSAVNNDRWIRFTITPVGDGYGFAFDTLSFNYGGSSGSTATYDARFQVRSSLDNFANPVGTTPALSIPASSPSTHTPGSYSIALGSMAAFTNVIGPIEFRIYGVFQAPTNFTSAQNISLRIDNIQLSGAVLVAPEPGTALLYAAGLLAAAAARRRAR